MGAKSEDKRAYILKKAREVFSKNGFSSVTMKDIVDACAISRGGLYLYFKSTAEIFKEVLQLESMDTDDVFDAAINEDSSITDILIFFLREQKKELLTKENTLTIATYEFYFKNKLPRKENTLRRTFDDAVHVLTDLISSGVNAGEFYCEDPRACARNIMLVIEGLKVSVNSMNLSMDTDRKLIDEQLDYLLDGLLV